jgi:Ca2+/Na+ antiporter
MLYITFLCFGFLLFEDDFAFANIAILFFGLVLVFKHMFKIAPKKKLTENKSPIDRYYPWILLLMLIMTTLILGRKKSSLLLNHPLVLILVWLAWLFNGLKIISQHEEASLKNKTRLNHKIQTK